MMWLSGELFQCPLAVSSLVLAAEVMERRLPGDPMLRSASLDSCWTKWVFAHWRRFFEANELNDDSDWSAKEKDLARWSGGGIAESGSFIVVKWETKEGIAVEKNAWMDLTVTRRIKILDGLAIWKRRHWGNIPVKCTYQSWWIPMPRSASSRSFDANTQCVNTSRLAKRASNSMKRILVSRNTRQNRLDVYHQTCFVTERMLLRRLLQRENFCLV